MYIDGPNSFRIGRLLGTTPQGRVQVLVFPNPFFAGSTTVTCDWWDGSGNRPTQNYACEVPVR